MDRARPVVVATLRPDPASPAIAPAVVDVLGEQSRDRNRLTGEEHGESVDRLAFRSAAHRRRCNADALQQDSAPPPGDVAEMSHRTD
jgi:hypothetical protein